MDGEGLGWLAEGVVWGWSTEALCAGASIPTLCPAEWLGQGLEAACWGGEAHVHTEHRLARSRGGDWPRVGVLLELSPSCPRAGARAGSCPSLGAAEPQGFPSWQETQLLFFLPGSLFCVRFSQAVCWITGPGEPAGRREAPAPVTLPPGTLESRAAPSCAAASLGPG